MALCDNEPPLAGVEWGKYQYVA